MRHNLNTNIQSFKTSRGTFSMTAAFAITLISCLSFESRSLSQTIAVQLNPGDIVYTDSGDAINGGFVVKDDSYTGMVTIVGSMFNLLYVLRRAFRSYG